MSHELRVRALPRPVPGPQARPCAPRLPCPFYSPGIIQIYSGSPRTAPFARYPAHGFRLARLSAHLTFCPGPVPHLLPRPCARTRQHHLAIQPASHWAHRGTAISPLGRPFAQPRRCLASRGAGPTAPGPPPSRHSAGLAPGPPLSRQSAGLAPGPPLSRQSAEGQDLQPYMTKQRPIPLVCACFYFFILLSRKDG